MKTSLTTARASVEPVGKTHPDNTAEMTSTIKTAVAATNLSLVKQDGVPAFTGRARALIERITPVTMREHQACREVVPALQSMLDEAQQLCVLARRSAACVGRAQRLAGRLADHSGALCRLRTAVTSPKAPRREVLGQLTKLASQLRERIREANSLLDEEQERNPLMRTATVELIALGRARRSRSTEARARCDGQTGFIG